MPTVHGFIVFRPVRVLLGLVFAFLLGSASLSGADKAAASTASDLRRVRLIYLVPSDREPKPRYQEAMAAALKDVQKWYAARMDGATFRMSSPVVEVARSDKPAAWFGGKPRPDDPTPDFFDNTLSEASRLLGAKYHDPNFIWIIYADAPGGGRGGSGVACLPEHDLLGLAGLHPREKDIARWVGGLGHEIGHAFGLPHPKDTVKHEMALMWLGYQRPDRAYLTDEDKSILRRSPFFYREDNSPLFDLRATVLRYDYAGGAFLQHTRRAPIFWSETKGAGETGFVFEELGRDANYIRLHDQTRGIIVRLPATPKEAHFSVDGEKTWSVLCRITAIRPSP